MENTVFLRLQSDYRFKQDFIQIQEPEAQGLLHYCCYLPGKSGGNGQKGTRGVRGTRAIKRTVERLSTL